MKKSVILFIHGGPGLSASYFNDWFECLKDKYDLCFYDQDYSYLSDSRLIDNLVEQFISKYQDLKSQYDEIVIFSHSWGSFLLLSAASEMKRKNEWANVSKIIISNPSDTSWEEYVKAGDRMFENASNEEIEAISNCQDGITMMNLALPLYVGNRNVLPKLLFDRYDLEAYDRIEEEMTDYEINSNVMQLPLDCTYSIYCENDFEKESGSLSIAQNTHKIVFAEAGHFPFAEKNEEFIALLRSILNE